MDARRQTSDLLLASYLRLPTSGLPTSGLPTLNFLPPTSYLRPPTSDFPPPTSYLRLLTLGPAAHARLGGRPRRIASCARLREANSHPAAARCQLCELAGGRSWAGDGLDGDVADGASVRALRDPRDIPRAHAQEAAHACLVGEHVHASACPCVYTSMLMLMHQDMPGRRPDSRPPLPSAPPCPPLARRMPAPAARRMRFMLSLFTHAEPLHAC